MILFGFIFLPLLYISLGFFPFPLKWKKVLALLTVGGNLVNAVNLIYKISHIGMIKVFVGSWPAPYGITLVADRMSAFLLLITAIIAVSIVLFSLQSVDRPRLERGYFQFVFGIIMGVNGSFIAGDLFNLYVWFEVMLMASFILMSHGGERPQLEGAIKYLILNLISSFFFVAGIGLLYGKMETLNLADLAYKISQLEVSKAILNPPLVLIVVGFAIKGALFPFFFWLPASYHTPVPVVSALFAGLLTKVGIYSLIRFYTLILYHNSAFWNPWILGVGTVSMVIGVFTASSQFDFRKKLSFHIISQVGYVVIGLGFFTLSGLAGALFFLGHNMLAKTNTYLVAGWVHKRKGTLDLKNLGDVFKESPVWSVLFIISAFSLAGLPPLSGFIGKYSLIKSGIEAHHLFISIVALFVGILTLFSMLKIWIEVFWKPVKDGVKSYAIAGDEKLMVTASGILALMSVLMGIFGVPIIDYCTEAAADLLSPEKYIRFVLNV